MRERKIDTDAVARRLVGLRTEALLTVEAAADGAGLDALAVNRAESGTFSLATLSKLNRAYKSNLDYLAFGEGPAHV